MKFRGQAKRLAAHAKKMGQEADISSSSISESVYVSLEPSGLRIRLSAHTARPTYDVLNGTPDFEVGPPTNQQSNGDIVDAIAWLARMLEKPIPPKIQAQIARREEAEREEMRVLRLRFHAEEAALRLRRFHILACPEAAELERQILAIRETGKKARRKRGALRDKMERAIANFDYTQDIGCLS